MSFRAMALGAMLVVIGFRALLSPSQNDTYWHLRAGADIWRTGHVPLVDSYSYTAAGLPWPDHEWLWQAITYGWYRAGGMPLMTAATGLLIVLAALLVYRLTVGAPVTRIAAMTIGVGLTAVVWGVRPQVATLLATVMLATLLARERFWPIPLLFLVWANLHGGVVLGGVVLVAVTVAALLRWRQSGAAIDRRRAGKLGLAVVLSGLASCATPLGVHIFRFVWDSTRRLDALRISEWRPSWPDNLVGGSCWVVAVAVLGLLVWRRRALADAPWPAWALATATVALMGPGFRALRNVAPFVLVAAPAATHLLGASFRLRPPSQRMGGAPASADHPRINLAIFGTLALAALVLVTAAYTVRDPWLGWEPISPTALAAVESCRAPLFNHYDDGGFLIWFAPDRPVFVDSRQDPYPLPFILETIAVERGDRAYQPMFAKWGIGCAFLKASSGMVGRLRTDGWQLASIDDQWAVLSEPPRAP